MGIQTHKRLRVLYETTWMTQTVSELKSHTPQPFKLTRGANYHGRHCFKSVRDGIQQRMYQSSLSSVLDLLSKRSTTARQRDSS